MAPLKSATAKAVLFLAVVWLGSAAAAPKPPPRPKPPAPPRPKPPRPKPPRPKPPRPRPPKPRPPRPKPPRPRPNNSNNKRPPPPRPPPPRPRPPSPRPPSSRPPSPRPPRPNPPPPPSCKALYDKCDVNPDCCNGGCNPTTQKCCEPDAASGSQIKSFNFATLPPEDRCANDTVCCNEHCVRDGPFLSACLSCIPVPLGKCSEDGDCCFGSKCQTNQTIPSKNATCCIRAGLTCAKQINTTFTLQTLDSLCCSGLCDANTKTCLDCVGVGSKGCSNVNDCCKPLDNNPIQCLQNRCCVSDGGDCITDFGVSDCCSGNCVAGKCQ